MNLAKEISFLLYKHNCVILPGFGAFLINQKGAELNLTAKYALPRQEVISFNRQITNNDGLVANHLSQLHHSSYELGLEKVEQYISYLWDILQTKRNVEVAEVGTFYFTQEEKLIFVPYHSVNFKRESYGLPKLRLKELSAIKSDVPTVSVPSPKPFAELKVIAAQDKPVFPEPIALDTKAIKTQEKQDAKAAKQAALVAKTKARNEALEERRREKQNANLTKKSGRISNLTLINTLGILFLVGMVGALINFEMNSQANAQLNNEIAGMLDVPTLQDSNTDLAGNDENFTPVTEIKTLPMYAIYAQVKSEAGAQALQATLADKYAGASTEITGSGSSEVFIISFSSEELANEYKTLIQNKINQKLVIKQK
jgi:hypothetical protein